MSLELPRRFSDEILQRILEQSMVHSCACPAQVCTQLKAQRSLFKYQQNCLNQTDTDEKVHRVIAETVIENHKLMEECLEEVVRLEGWNMETYEMPKDIKKRLISDLEP